MKYPELKQGFSVLIVEDDPSFVGLIQSYLSSDPGFSVRIQTATSLIEALRCLKSSRFEIILLDLSLPDSDGLDTYQRISQAAGRVPVMIVSGGSGTERIALESVHRGAQDYLIKGEFQKNDFLRALHFAMERSRLSEKLRQSEERYHDLFENIQDMIFAVDPRGRMLYANRSTQRKLGYRAEEMPALSLKDIISSDQLRTWQALLRKFSHGKGDMQVETVVESVFKARNGSEIMVEGNVSVNRSQGKILYTRAIFRDVTLRKRHEKELKLYRNKLEQLVRERTAALSVSNRKLKGEIVQRKKLVTELEEKNITLRQLLSQLQEEKKQLGVKVLSNVDQLVFPAIRRLKGKIGDGDSLKHLDILENNLRDITSEFGDSLSRKYYRLTSREIEVCNLIRGGIQTKEIAALLHLSIQTVEKHRNRIRQKLGISSHDINLATHLKTF